MPLKELTLTLFYAFLSLYKPSPMTQQKCEIRRLTLEILQKKINVLSVELRHFEDLASSVAEALAVPDRRRMPKKDKPVRRTKLSDSDLIVLIDVFWDLVGEGILSTADRPTDSEKEKGGFPYFRVISSGSRKGKSSRAEIPRSKTVRRPSRSAE